MTVGNGLFMQPFLLFMCLYLLVVVLVVEAGLFAAVMFGLLGAVCYSF
jgi:hypothetical protein